MPSNAFSSVLSSAQRKGTTMKKAEGFISKHDNYIKKYDFDHYFWRIIYIFLFLCCVPLSAFKAFSCFFCFWTLFVLKGLCCFSNGSKRFHIISNMSKCIQMGPKNPTILHPGYIQAYLIFVISFTQAAFSNSKFYTRK